MEKKQDEIASYIQKHHNEPTSKTFSADQ